MYQLSNDLPLEISLDITNLMDRKNMIGL